MPKLNTENNVLPFMPEKMLPSMESPHILVARLGATDQLRWDAAVMLGSGRMDELRAYIKDSQGHGSESSYSLGIGMARLDGDKESFDELAVEFAVNLGVNPPTWIEQHSRVIKTEVDINQIGVNSLEIESIVDATIKMESPWPIRLDFSKVTAFNMMGLELFNESMGSRLDRKLRTFVVGGNDLLNTLSDYVSVNPLSESKAAWGFIFLYLKLTNQPDVFDKNAKKYLALGGDQMVFENLAEKIEEKPEVKIENRGVPLGDKLSALNQEFARKILKSAGFEKFASGEYPVVIDFAQTRIASLVDIIPLSGFMVEMSSQNVRLEFANVNEIILGILRAIGVNENCVKLSAPGAE